MAVISAISIELRNQSTYGASCFAPVLPLTVLCSRLPKLCSVTCEGITCALCSELLALNADETM